VQFKWDDDNTTRRSGCASGVQRWCGAGASQVQSAGALCDTQKTHSHKVQIISLGGVTRGWQIEQSRSSCGISAQDCSSCSMKFNLCLK